MLFFPVRVDVPLYRWPISNFAILAVILVTFIWEVTTLVGGNPQAVEPFVLDGWNPLGMIGHIFLHGGLMHLIGNMLFLWIFGNAVCEKVGNIAYPFIFLGLGVFAGVIHNVMDGDPAIGASGAINAIVGMFVVWFPLNAISVFYFVWLFIVFIRYGTFDLSSYWLILLWLIFDVWGAVSGSGDVAYWAHLGGFASGVVLAWLLTQFKMVTIYDTEQTLLHIMGLAKHGPKLFNQGRASARGLAAQYVHSRQAPPARSIPLATAPAEKPRPVIPDQPIPYEAPKQIRFRCECGKVMAVPPSFAGKVGRCKGCGKRIRVPGL